MDTKLKDKKFGLKLILVFLTVCIGITLGSWIAIRNDIINIKYYGEYVKYEFETTFRNVKDLMLYTDGLYGNLREDSVKSEVENIKKAGGLFKGDGQTPMTDEEIGENVINYFNNHVLNEQANLKNCTNIEFYFDMEDGRQPYTNVNVGSKEEFEEDTLKNYDDYIIIKANREIETSKRLEKVLSYLQGVTIDGNYLVDYKHDIYLRVSNPLKPGDTIYENVTTYNKWRTYGYGAIAALVISLMGIIYSVVKARGKDLHCIVDDTIVKVLEKIGIEIKLVVLVPLIFNRIGALKKAAYHIDILKVVVTLVIPLYIVILEILRLKFKYDKAILKDLIINESIIKKIIDCLIKKGLVVSLLFVIVNAAMWWISFIIFVYLGMQYYLLIDYLYPIIFATIMTLLFDVIIVRYLNSISEIVEGIRKISKGNYNCNINVEKSKFFKGIAGDLEHIQEGLKEAVDNAVKSEKMKSELITNVSHDLKTPLTSIISYVDLLSQENVNEEQREKYLNVLKDKSNRLKVLIEDLFEVSKASSGSVELDMVKLDPVSLIRQTLGEFEDKIEKSDLKIIKKLPKEKLTVYADGRKTFRVFQNLISNALKYSMEGSRVYIEVEDEEEFIKITFKNTSREELNFTEEEIIQRFKRGDTSRTTEGSGLGLAIAKSLTEVQKGKFEIKIDGDLFKVVVKLKKRI